LRNAENGAGLIRRNARYSENGGSTNGTEKRWLITIWNASPRRINSCARRTRRSCSAWSGVRIVAPETGGSSVIVTGRASAAAISSPSP